MSLCRSKIPWLLNADGTPGYTWSPTSGCSPASSGCASCWAKAYHVRYRGGDFSVKLHPEKLDEPLRLRTPSTIGVSLMGDLFHDDVPDEFIAAVFGIMAAAERHTFIVLTKRPERMRSILSNVKDDWTLAAEDYLCAYENYLYAYEESCKSFRQLNTGWFKDRPLPNVWPGVSIEDQATADERIPILLDTPAAHRWVSLEPQIGAVEFTSWWLHGQTHDVNEHGEATHGPALDLVIQGCESGPRRRPFDLAWARSVRDQCKAAGVAYYLKQIQRCTDDDCHAYGTDNGCGMEWTCESGRKNTVREKPTLDGRQHLGLPWEVKP